MCYNCQLSCYIMQEISINRFALLKSSFKSLVGEKDFLNKEEYKIYNVVATGYIPSDAEVELLFGTKDILPCKEVEAIVLKKMQNETNHLRILEMFRAFDGDFKGYIDKLDLSKACRSATSRLSWKVLHESFNEVAPAGNLDYDTFKNLCLTYDLM